MTSIEILKHIENLIKDKISYEEIVTRTPYVSTQRIIAYKRVLVDIKRLKKFETKNQKND
jgi:hypothetical protein